MYNYLYFQQSARIIFVSWWNNESWSFILKLHEYLSHYYAAEGASYYLYWGVTIEIKVTELALRFQSSFNVKVWPSRNGVGVAEFLFQGNIVLLLVSFVFRLKSSHISFYFLSFYTGKKHV